MSEKIKILGICGSLRKLSYNKGLLHAAKELAPADCQIHLFDLKDIPLYNQDEEKELPSAVADLKNKIKNADAILIACPEFNYSISGVLKNALDWASRPYGDNSWDNKPVAIIGASAGMQGTARAQYHLRQVFVTLNMHALNRPEFMIPSAQDKFDAQGHLVDLKSRQKLEEVLKALIAYTKQLKA